jgi:hypothetical protein
MPLILCTEGNNGGWGLRGHAGVVFTFVGMARPMDDVHACWRQEPHRQPNHRITYYMTWHYNEAGKQEEGRQAVLSIETFPIVLSATCACTEYSYSYSTVVPRLCSGRPLTRIVYPVSPITSKEFLRVQDSPDNQCYTPIM